MLNEETISLVSRYMQGDTLPLSGRALRESSDGQHELMWVKNYAEAAVTYIKKTMPLDHHISGFDGNEIKVQCSCPEHPHQSVPVRANKAWLPKLAKDESGKRREWHITPSFFAIAPATKIKPCSFCEEERTNTAILMRPVCRYHPDVVLKADLVCKECAGGVNLLCLDGRSITLVNRGAVTTAYKCPMHGDYSVGHRANDHGCPTCNSYDGITAYAATLKRSDIDEIKRVKAIAERMIKKYLRKNIYHPAIGPQKIAMIRELVKRCYDYKNNMHLLAVFPTSKFIHGEWLRQHQPPGTLPKSMNEYLMPFAQDLIDVDGSDKVSMIDTANVACDIGWRTAHWSRHKEFI